MSINESSAKEDFFIGSFSGDEHIFNKDNEFVIDSDSEKLDNYFDDLSSKFNTRKAVNVYGDYTYFKNITDDNGDQKFLKMELNGTVYNVCQFYDYPLDFIFSSHNINWSNIDILRTVTGFDEFFDKNVNIVQEISEMKQWQNELNSISNNGYGYFYSKEINELYRSFISNYHKMAKNIADDVIEKYFNYSESIVKDLSVLDDVKYFFFGNQKQLFWSLSNFFSHQLNTVFYIHFKKESNTDLIKIFDSIFHHKEYSPENIEKRNETRRVKCRTN